MDKNLFSSYIKIVDVPINYRDLSINYKHSFDINHDLPHFIDGEELIHFFFKPRELFGQLEAIESHNKRVTKWNINHPKYRIKKLSGEEVKLHPIYIKNNLFFNVELFKLMDRYGTKNLTRRLNKSALEYFKEKIRLSKKHNISTQTENNIQYKIIKINEWFVNYNIDPDEIESLLEEVNEKGYSDKLVTLFEEGIEDNIKDEFINEDKDLIKNDSIQTGELEKSKGGRPAVPKIAERNKKINHDYYILTKKNHLNKQESIKRLSEKYSLALSTIEKYLK